MSESTQLPIATPDVWHRVVGDPLEQMMFGTPAVYTLCACVMPRIEHINGGPDSTGTGHHLPQCPVCELLYAARAASRAARTEPPLRDQRADLR